MSSAAPTPSTIDPFEHGLPTVHGKSVKLRPFAPDDAEEVYRLYADKDAVRYGYSPKMDDLADALKVIETTLELARSRTLFHWGVADLEHDRIVGHATLLGWAPQHRRAELGYSVRKDLWGKGLGTDAAATLVGYAFEHLGLRRLEADVDPRNVSSLRVLEKLGFLREGYLRERWELGGEVQDGIFFGLLRREWAGHRFA
jgi:ribosomal-protein-alanine N-acetyltransferase